MVSRDEYIDAAIETGADAIVVSSIYGHGDIDCLGMRECCIERGLGNILLYVGGNRWSENMTSLTWKPSSKRWDLIASFPQVMT